MLESQGAPDEFPAPQKPDWMTESHWQNYLTKRGKMHGTVVELGIRENCHEKRVSSSGMCIRCGHRQGHIK